MQQHAERLMRAKADALDDRKRVAPPDSIARDATTDAKRQRLGAPVQSVIQVEAKPIGPGPHSLATVFTLTEHEGLRNFDVGQVPAGLAARISTSVLQQLDPLLLAKAISVRDFLTDWIYVLLTNSVHSRETSSHGCRACPGAQP
jgi:symplekin